MLKYKKIIGCVSILSSSTLFINYKINDNWNNKFDYDGNNCYLLTKNGEVWRWFHDKVEIYQY